MADAAPRLYKMMGSVMISGVIVVAMFADYWPWSLLGFALVALAVVGEYFTNWVQVRYVADRKQYLELIYRCDLQAQAGIEGDMEQWFYGDYVPADEFNIFSDHWEKSLEPEPAPLPPPPTEPLRPGTIVLAPGEACEGEADCTCRDCRAERRARQAELRARESAEHHRGCGCEVCHRARVRQLRRDRNRPGRLRVPVAGTTDWRTGEKVTHFNDGTTEYTRVVERQPVAQVREYGQRDPVRTFYCDDDGYDRDWWDEA